jgi:hypothetical protein
VHCDTLPAAWRPGPPATGGFKGFPHRAPPPLKRAGSPCASVQRGSSRVGLPRSRQPVETEIGLPEGLTGCIRRPCPPRADIRLADNPRGFPPPASAGGRLKPRWLRISPPGLPSIRMSRSALNAPCGGSRKLIVGRRFIPSAEAGGFPAAKIVKD